MMNWDVKKREQEKIIGDYIASGRPYRDILQNDERVFVSRYLSPFANGIFAWYPFQEGAKILQIGSWFGSFSEMLYKNAEHLDILEQDEYRAKMTEIRMQKVENVRVVHGTVSDILIDDTGMYDFVVCAVDERHDLIRSKQDYADTIEQCKKLLKDDGRLLFAFPNRFAWKYMSGLPEPSTGIPFCGITDDDAPLYRFDRAALKEVVEKSGFSHYKFYYPMPDLGFTQMIYTDEYLPKKELKERLFLCHENKGQRVLDEWMLLDSIASNGTLPFLSDSFIVEIGQSECSRVTFAALSTERSRENSFCTAVYSDRTVRKTPLYEEGIGSIQRILGNAKELRNRNINVMDMSEENGAIQMEYEKSPTLSDLIKQQISSGEDSFIDTVGRLWEKILQTSDAVEGALNCMAHYRMEADWGPILHTAFIEMIPVNCFYTDDELVFFDQEYTMEDCPAKFVLFRAIRDIYSFSPEADKIYPLEKMKEDYGLTALWDYFQKEEDRFQHKLRQRDIYRGFMAWGHALIGTMKDNRRLLADSSNHRNMFDVWHSLDMRRVVLFGTGKYATGFVQSASRKPVFAVDNDGTKWGSTWNGYEVKSPDVLKTMMPGSYLVVIAIKNYRPVAEQLENMGLSKEDYRILNAQMGTLSEAAAGSGKYEMGYVAGAYDMFHIGHVNLFRRAKQFCNTLLVGVLPDEAVLEQKNKHTVIPQEQRLEMVKSCRYVDGAVLLPVHGNSIRDAYGMYGFDCMFTGSDYENNPVWLKEREYLRAHGSELIFFPYTVETSSTVIRKELGIAKGEGFV